MSAPGLPGVPRAADRRPASRAATPAVLLAAMLAPLASPAAAQSAASRPALGEVVVTATRVPSRVDETVAEVTVIDRAEIERSPSQTFSELLARQPGIQITTTGGPGQSASVFVRGLESRHTLLLVDGMRLGSSVGGTIPFDTLPTTSFERVEIVRGPLSAVYGSDAVGGVIQAFTRTARPGFAPNASLLAGSERTARASAGFAFGGDAVDGAVQLTHFGTRGFSATTPGNAFSYNPDLDGFRQNAGSGRLGLQLSPDWRLDASVLEADGRVDADEGPGNDPRAKLRASVRTLAARGRLSAGWTTRLSVGDSTDDYRALESFFGTGAFRTRQRQYQWENQVATPIGTAVALLERIEQRVDLGDAGPTVVTRRDIDAAGLGLAGEAGRHAWQLGARHDRNSQFGGQSTGTVGYGWAATDALRLGATVGTSFVAPDFGRLYFPGFANPDLRPERGRHAELSARWTAGAHSLRVGYVDNRIDDYFVNGPGFVPINVDRARIDGWVLSYAGTWGGWRLGASYERLDPRNDAPGDANFGRRLQRRSKDALRASVDVPVGALSFGGTLVAFSDRFDDAANTQRLGGFATLDLRTDWRLDRAWTLGLRLDNLADKRYETAQGFAQPGRRAFVVASWAPPAR